MGEKDGSLCPCIDYQAINDKEPIPPSTDDYDIRTPAMSHYLHKTGSPEGLSSCTHPRRGEMEDGVQHSHRSMGVSHSAFRLNERSDRLPGTGEWCAQGQICLRISGWHSHILQEPRGTHYTRRQGPMPPIREPTEVWVILLLYRLPGIHHLEREHQFGSREGQSGRGVAQMHWPAALQLFLGFANFHRWLIRNYSTIAAPLSHITSVKVCFACDHEAERAFLDLKRRFTTAPILVHPDPKAQFIVEVDASNVGVGAILSQRSAGDSKVHLCVYTHPLSLAKQNYDIGNKELLTVKLTLEEWWQWLEGAQVPFQVWTDHKNLECLHSGLISLVCPTVRRGALLAPRLSQTRLSLVQQLLSCSDAAMTKRRRARHAASTLINSPSLHPSPGVKLLQNTFPRIPPSTGEWRFAISHI